MRFKRLFVISNLPPHRKTIFKISNNSSSIQISDEYNNNRFIVHQITYKDYSKLEGTIDGLIARKQSLTGNHNDDRFQRTRRKWEEVYGAS